MKRSLQHRRHKNLADRRRRKRERRQKRLRFRRKVFHNNQPVIAEDIEWIGSHIFAPRIFSLLRNPEGTIAFINKLNSRFHRGKSVFFNLSDVREMDSCAILALLPTVIKFKMAGIRFNGSYPKANSLRRKLDWSGFFDVLGIDNIEAFTTYQHLQNSIYTNSNHQADPALIVEQIKKCAKTIHGRFFIYKGLNACLTEMMQNTIEHAEPKRREKGPKDWWLVVEHNKALKKVKFYFLDIGIGVFRSLATGQSPISNAVQSLFPRWSEDTSTTLKAIMQGFVHKTSTDLSYRGTGLPRIYYESKNNTISRVQVITNKVHGILDSDSFVKLNNEFAGTFYYWELDENTVCTKTNRENLWH